MSKLHTGISVADTPALHVVDMRDEVITNAAQFMEAIHRFRANHTEEIGWIHVSPTQEYCLKIEHLKGIYNVKEDRPYTLEEIGSLEQFMGYKVFVLKRE